MEVKEIELRKSEVVTDIICDCCGDSCKKEEYTVENDARIDNGEKKYIFSFMNLEAGWDYYSGKDMEHWTAQICEKCVDEKLSFIKFNKGKTKFSQQIN